MTALVLAFTLGLGLAHLKSEVLKNAARDFQEIVIRMIKMCIRDSPYISLSFVWHKLERQIHIEGKAERCAPADSCLLYTSRCV